MYRETGIASGTGAVGIYKRLADLPFLIRNTSSKHVSGPRDEALKASGELARGTGLVVSGHRQNDARKKRLLAGMIAREM
jgi:hypothetical protein